MGQFMRTVIMTYHKTFVEETLHLLLLFFYEHKVELSFGFWL